MSKVVVISRQFGSGGRTIGKELAERLAIPCYDHEIIEKVAQSSGFAKEYIETHGEYANHLTWIGRALDNQARANGISNQDAIWIEQRKIILEVSKTACVIVGRCADYILKDRDDVLKAFIHADDNFRIDRIQRLYGEKDGNLEKSLKEKDKRRKAYYKYYTETEWGDAANYDIALDSGKLGIERCVDILEKLYKEI